jgi:hypothetical protein
LIRFLEGLAKVLFFGGLVLALGGIGGLILNYVRGGSATEASIVSNVALFSGPAFWGALAAGLGAAYLYWAEDILAALLILASCILLFSPSYVPLLITTNPTSGDLILEALTKAGLGLGLVALFVFVWEVISRIRMRVMEGVRSDQLKYGKGIKEEKDIRNVFMGKCWQLPYCRKFVRERCPIYHARRTCWKERVGCMCEESVIRNAMEGKVIPKDMVAASKFIPKNSRLTPEQKAERCRMCVIYNEHQKHKYKLALPLSFAAFGVLYFALNAPIAEVLLRTMTAANKVMSSATIGAVQANAVNNAPTIGPLGLHQVLVVIIFFIGAVYSIKVIEFVIFRAKL